MSTKEPSANISSYEIGHKPYKHDVTRGKWLSLADFYTASLAHTFSFRHFTSWPFFLVNYGGIFVLIPYILNLCIFIIPIFFIQSFLGQFSSSGFISAFRIAPMFKGIGYVILLLNVTSLCYFVVIASTPLIYFLNSLSPTLPWMSCDNHWNTPNCTVHIGNDTSDLELASGQFFYYGVSLEGYLKVEISWRILMCTLVVWSLIGLIVMTGVEIMGTIIRYFTIVIGSCLLILFIRFLFLQGASDAILNFFNPQLKIFAIEIWLISPITSLLSFGAGWGIILTMSSYNNFNENIGKYAFNISFINLGILLVTALISNISYEHIKEEYPHLYYVRDELPEMYTIYSYLLGTMSGSNILCLIFFLMLFLGELTGCVIQMFSITTAIFDEFESIRIYKKEFIVVSIFFLSLISIGFSLNASFYVVNDMFTASSVTQMLICFVELMVVLWVYGRLRFQRDIEFMLNVKYPTWKFFLVRFVTPVLTLLSMGVFFVISFLHMHHYLLSYLIVFCLKILPVIIIPIMIVWQLYRTTGTIWERFKNLCRPSDWYPVDPSEQLRYATLPSANETGFEDLIDENDYNIKE